MEGVNDFCRIRRAAVFWQRWSLWILRVETFSFQLGQAVIKSTDNRTRVHDLKLMKLAH